MVSDFIQSRGFYSRRPLQYEATGCGVNFKAVTLPDCMDFMMRPVLAGICKMESLYNGTLDLNDFALMNDALNARAENEIRAQKASQNQ